MKVDWSKNLRKTDDPPARIKNNVRAMVMWFVVLLFYIFVASGWNSRYGSGLAILLVVFPFVVAFDTCRALLMLKKHDKTPKG